MDRRNVEKDGENEPHERDESKRHKQKKEYHTDSKRGVTSNKPLPRAPCAITLEKVQSNLNGVKEEISRTKSTIKDIQESIKTIKENLGKINEQLSSVNNNLINTTKETGNMYSIYHSISTILAIQAALILAYIGLNGFFYEDNYTNGHIIFIVLLTLTFLMVINSRKALQETEKKENEGK